MNRSIAATPNQATLAELASHHGNAWETHRRTVASDIMERAALLAPKLAPALATSEFRDYLVDAGQRWAIFLDVMRKAGNQYRENERHGGNIFLAFDFDVVVDGARLARPVNYSLVRIRPGTGDPIEPAMRPYVIIDPRAGHGSGIGGFKEASEVGVALKAGHPVYFMVFTQRPQPGQTIADVTRAEAYFVREVQRLHPQAAKPIVVGNCQGGWGAALLAATNPDITGPIVLNGSPMSYWAGVLGRDPMRYLGAASAGGIMPVMLLSDLNGGVFDGANLVLNFENLNPGNSWFAKYYDVLANVDTGAERFLEFERWWTAFFMMNEQEIRWIVENLFVGNKVVRGQAQLEPGMHVDLRNIKAPIIVFASHGDNITPPAQALHWISQVYRSLDEIRARGQRIVYTVHDSIGHLGIFVSAKIADKEHKEIFSTLRSIESLAPGLYELVITDAVGEGMQRSFGVSLEERSLDDIRAFSRNRDDDAAFAAASRVAEHVAESYELLLRPWVKAMVNPSLSAAVQAANPVRLRCELVSDANPLMRSVAGLADAARRGRKPAPQDNPFRLAEKLMADVWTQYWNSYRTLRDGWLEMAFHARYGNPFIQALGGEARVKIAETAAPDPVSIPQVAAALRQLEEGGYPAAVIRMMILLARSRGGVRRDRLERLTELLSREYPFNGMPPDRLADLIDLQTIIAAMSPDPALAALPRMLASMEEREAAVELCERVAGQRSEMADATAALFDRFRSLLDIGGRQRSEAESAA